MGKGSVAHIETIDAAGRSYRARCRSIPAKSTVPADGVAPCPISPTGFRDARCGFLASRLSIACSSASGSCRYSSLNREGLRLPLANENRPVHQI